MATIKVVENPRRKKRRSLSVAQRRAGFGGRRSMSGTSRRGKRVKSRRRRNPAMASLGNPRQRRRPRYTVTGVARRRRRNPKFGPFNIDLTAAAWIAGGGLSVEMMPRLVRRFWPALPTAGAMGYGVKVGSALVMGLAVGKLVNARAGNLVAAGGLSVILIDLARQYVMPHLPFLSGLGNNASFVQASELEDVYGLDGYVDASPGPGPGLGTYVEGPVGGY